MLLVAPSMPPNLHFVGCRGEWVADSESFGQDTWIFRIHHGIELEPGDAESSRCISIEERLIAGHLLLARLTPSRPKIDEHHFATESLGRNLMSFEILHRELRKERANLPGLISFGTATVAARRPARGDRAVGNVGRGSLVRRCEKEGYQKLSRGASLRGQGTPADPARLRSVRARNPKNFLSRSQIQSRQTDSRDFRLADRAQGP